MDLKTCINEWNLQSDGWNQWESLGCDEQLNWVVEVMSRETRQTQLRCADLEFALNQAEKHIDALRLKKVER